MSNNFIYKKFSVVNRKGQVLNFDISQIKNKLTFLSNIYPKLDVDINKVIDIISKGLVNLMKTSDINDYVAKVCEGMKLEDYQYSYLGARLIMNNLVYKVKKELPKFSDISEKYKDMFWNKYSKFIKKNKEYLDNLIDEKKNFKYSYMGIATLKKSYLLINKKKELIETPQYMLLRVAVNLWCNHNSSTENKLNMIKETYTQMSDFKYTHATPTLFNSGTVMNCLISCYLQQLPSDSIEGIFELFKRTAKLQKSAGGVATHIHLVRAIGSLINSSNRQCDGIVKILQILENIAHYVNQNGKRAGSNAIYLEVWYYQLFDFLDMANPFTPKAISALDLFYAVYANDYFFEMIEKDDYWYLLCPHKYPGLSEVYGKEFIVLYKKHIKKALDNELIVEIKNKKEYKNLKHKNGQVIKVKARVILGEILKLMLESGKPYILNKDQINDKSGMKNAGIIKSSNLCCEITLPSSPTETAICCLASIKVSEFYNIKTKKYDWESLKRTIRLVVINLNRVLDVNIFVTKETKLFNSLHRPIGIGMQDLAGLFMIMNINYYSDEAKQFGAKLQEFIYFNALDTSCEISRKEGPYKSFKGSSASKGILQFDMWEEKSLSKELDWDNLKKNIKLYGLRNSTLLANMPTASTSYILDSTVEAFTPLVSNIYTRKVSTGEFIIVNKYLVDDLKKIGIWSKYLAESISKKYDGKIGELTSIPKEIRDKYSTVYEFGNKAYIDMVAGMAPFCCQSFSMNIYPKLPDTQDIFNIIMYGYKKRLKTICYYTRTDPASKAILNTNNKDTKKLKKKWVCNGDEECTMCSS